MMTVATPKPVTSPTTPAEAEAIADRLWSREEYDQMVEMGFFEGQRIQLIEGRIVEMSPQNAAHAICIELCTDCARDTFPKSEFRVRVQLPLYTADGSAPEPDIAIVRGQARGQVEHPRTAELAIEVSDSTLRLDREKARLYAASNVPEYWIVNLIDRRVEVHREPAESPSGWSYTRITLHAADETIAPQASPDAKVIVRDLLP